MRCATDRTRESDYLNKLRVFLLSMRDRICFGTFNTRRASFSSGVKRRSAPNFLTRNL